MKYFSRYSAALCLAGMVLPASAQTLISDPFNYTVAPLNSQGGWVTYSGATPNQVNVLAGSLTTSLTGFPTPTGNKVELTEAESEDVFKSFTAVTGEGSNVYAGLLCNITGAPSGTGSYFAQFHQPASTSAFFGRIWIRPDGAGFNFGVSYGSGTATFETTTRNYSETYVTVLKVALVAGTVNDVVSLYVNPSSVTTEPGVATVSFTSTGTDVAPATGLGNIGLRQSIGTASPAGMGTLTVDELRVGTTYASSLTGTADVSDWNLY